MQTEIAANAIVEVNTQEDEQQDMMRAATTPALHEQIQEDEIWWFQRFEMELERERRRSGIGAHVCQIRYLLRQLRIEGVNMVDRTEALEPMMVAYEDEPVVESRDDADHFFARWSHRIRSFLWTNLRAGEEGRPAHDSAALQEREEIMLQNMREEVRQEGKAAEAQLADDRAMAQAMGADTRPGEDRTSRPSSEGVVKGSKRPRDDTEVTVTSASVQAEPNGTSLTVRVFLRRDVAERSVQTD